jgi:large subunit ribosomal protein L10
MLLYAFNGEDEVAPAQILAKFAKENPSIEFVGAISAEGKLLSAEEVKALATLPSKAQLIAEVVATLLSPVHDVTNALSGNLHALLDGVEVKATA